MNDGVEERYRALQAAIGEELGRWRRDPGDVTLVGISKGQSPASIAAAVGAGLKDIGESYLQEAQRKLLDVPAVRKHFVGHLQTNKAKAVAAAFDVVQSVDRLAAGEALSRAAVDLGKELPILLQLNLTPGERFGCTPENAPRLADSLRKEPGLRLEGVMAIGPHTGDRDAILSAFELAAKTLAQVGGSTLSIGMSEDWRIALRAGSTMLRIGEALFGPRTYGRHR